MKLMWFHLMPYTELPDDFREQNPSVWVDIHSSLFDPTRRSDVQRFHGRTGIRSGVRLRRGLRE
jgi:hypothetical protein